MFKDIVDRFEKDVNGALTTLLVLGIIIEGQRVWTYQIKQRFRILTNQTDNIPTSSLYAMLNKLETMYGLITSEKDEVVQRRFYLPTKDSLLQYQRLQDYWFQLMDKSRETLASLQIKQNVPSR